MGKKWDKRKKVKFFVILSTCSSLLLVTILLVLWSILLIDKNRTNHKRSDIEYAEVIKKNYVKGFENTKDTGIFSFRLREDEINDFLLDGVKEINDKHISSVYYEKNEDDNHIFYVDLKKTFFKTRAVISISISDKSDSKTLKLDIDSVKIGKVDASKLLVSKGYLTPEFVDKYFEASHLPITFDKESFTFDIKVDSYINMFPKGELASLLWDQAKLVEGCVGVNSSTLGLKAYFSKLRNSYNGDAIPVLEEIPNCYDSLLEASNTSGISSWEIGETRTIYQISELDINTLLKESISSTKKEEVTSELTSNKVVFDITNASASLSDENKITYSLFVSINGYLIDVKTFTNFNDYPDTSFNVSMEVQNEVVFVGTTHKTSNNQYVTYFAGYLREIFRNIQAKHGNFFVFNETQHSFKINTQYMDSSITDDKFKDSFKSVEINPNTKTIDFKATKLTP